VSRGWLVLAVSAVVAVPAIVPRLLSLDLPSTPIRALVFGIGIFGAAFLLAWAAEVTQNEIGQGIALATLALVAYLEGAAVAAVYAHRRMVPVLRAGILGQTSAGSREERTGTR
jgi:hypothetical protein